VSRRAGIAEEQLRELAEFESSVHFNEREKLALRLSAALTRIPAVVSDELYQALRAQYSERELAELSAVIAWENARARFNRTFAIESDDYSRGQFCPLPER
jgi:alkylhydroperoxidase family enzyme